MALVSTTWSAWGSSALCKKACKDIDRTFFKQKIGNLVQEEEKG